MANQYSTWTEKELAFLQENAQTMTVKKLMQYIPKKESTIYKKIKELGIKKWDANGEQWSEEDITYLEDNYFLYSYTQIGKKLGRSKSSVEQKARNMGLQKVMTKPWSEDDIQYLTDNINSTDYETIGRYLKRSIQACRTKAHDLGLVSYEWRGQKLKKEQQQFIIANADKHTDSYFADKFKCSIEAVEAVRKRHGIHKVGNEVKGKTLPEQKVHDILDTYPVDFIYNQPCGEYRPDFINHEIKIVIEVQGDYWHCNPYLYPDGPKDEIQIKHIVRDYYKKCYFLSRGYRILYLWENEIMNNIEKVKDRIDMILTAVLERNL